MKFLGFNFTKVSAQKEKAAKIGSVNTNVDFISIEKDKIELLKDSEILEVSFKFAINYESFEQKKSPPEAQVIFEGLIVIAAEKDEAKEILKDWKEKKISQSFRNSLFNIVLSKCSIKALSLEEELGLPSHFPLPMHISGKE